jgi:electron transfer flavoprotein beta subunit
MSDAPTPRPDADGRPLVVACVRITDLRPEVDPLTGAVRRDRWGVGLSAADAAAVEHAFRIAGAWQGRVAVVTAADEAAEPVLREAVALGAAVVRIAADERGVPGPADPGHTGLGPDTAYLRALGADEQSLAAAIVAALAPLGTPALVLCGDRSPDRGTGALPAFVAHGLGAAQALGLVAIEADDGAVLVERRLDGGWRERLRVPCPAVCSVEAAGVRLRRAPLPDTLAARRAEVPVVTPADRAGPSLSVSAPEPFRPRTRVIPAPADADPRLRLLALTGALVEHDPPTVVGPVGAAEAADALLAYLARQGYGAGAAGTVAEAAGR